MKNLEKRNALVGNAKVICVMENALVYPANLMKPLCMAIVQDTTKPVTSNLSDIKPYAVYCKETGEFLGSLYAMDYAGRYYANIIGAPEIVCFEKDAFHFEQVEDVCFPFEEDFFLRCEFAGSMDLRARELVEVETGSVVHNFGEGLAFFKALILSREMIYSA